MKSATISTFDPSQLHAAVAEDADPIECWLNRLDELNVLAPIPALRSHLAAAPIGVPADDLQLLSDVIAERARAGGLGAMIS